MQSDSFLKWNCSGHVAQQIKKWKTLNEMKAVFREHKDGNPKQCIQDGAMI